MDGVELQEVRVHCGVAHGIVDPRDLGASFQQGLEGELPDPAEAIEGVDGHAKPPGLAPRPISSTFRCTDRASSAWMLRDVNRWSLLRSAP